MSALAEDVWSAPRAESPVVRTEVPVENQSKRDSLFLSDSEEDDTGDGQRAAAKPGPSSKENGSPPTLGASRLDAMFGDLDGDDDGDVFKIAPALDVEGMKRKADAQAATKSFVNKSLVPSVSSDNVADKNGSKKREEKEGKSERPRRTVAKLDEERLLSAEGFPRLLKDSKNFKVTGKGHEVADIERLFRLYHGWTHKLFPKFQFKDTVDRVEKLCHSRRMEVNLRAWKDETDGIMPDVGREDVMNHDEDAENRGGNDARSSRGQGVNAAGDSPSPSSRPSTPVTRPESVASTASSSATDQEIMDVDIEVLLREEEEMMREIQGTNQGEASYKQPDEDELWAATGNQDEMDDKDLWNIMTQMEAQSATDLTQSHQ